MHYRIQTGNHVTIQCGTHQDFRDSYERDPETTEECTLTAPDADASYLYNDPNDKTSPRMIDNAGAREAIQGYDEGMTDEISDMLLAALQEPGQYCNADEPWAAKARITRIS